MSNALPSAAALRRAVEIAERISKLESELKSLLAGELPPGIIGTGPPAKTRRTKKSPTTSPRKKRRPMSREARARIVAAQKARWAKWRKKQ